ncbi:MAG: hypothetical protein ACRDJW_10005 [Thermomicrobiales bacterium]
MAWTWLEQCRIDRAEGVAAAGGVGSGFVGGLLASLCCLPPALALALGLGGSTFLVSLGAYQTEFRAAGLVLTGLAVWWTLRRRARACRTHPNPIPFLLLSLGSFVAAYLVLTYVVTPFLYDVYARR